MTLKERIEGGSVIERINGDTTEVHYHSCRMPDSTFPDQRHDYLIPCWSMVEEGCIHTRRVGELGCLYQTRWSEEVNEMVKEYYREFEPEFFAEFYKDKL